MVDVCVQVFMEIISKSGSNRLISVARSVLVYG